jgi:PTH1 family peptidyl-tRNA hydrolase
VEGSTPQIRLIAGLGNPGAEYASTRHNIGFMVADQLAAQFGSTWEKSTKWDALLAKCGDVFLTKPMSYMNRSGYPLLAIAQFYKIDPTEILAVLDDMALPLGRLRLRLALNLSLYNLLQKRSLASALESERLQLPDQSITY